MTKIYTYNYIQYFKEEKQDGQPDRKGRKPEVS